MKIMTIIGTRPEIIKLSLVLKELDKYANHIIVYTGQNYNYELSKIFFEDLKIRTPDYFLEVAQNNLAQDIANIIVQTDKVMEQEKPDAILVYGDTNSCLAVINAKRRQIPIFHMEAGNRCFDQRTPEEGNRKIIDHISDINLTITEHARRYLVMEGIKPETVIKVGSCVKELVEHYKDQIDKSTILTKLKFSPKEYFVVSTHREENVDSPKNLIMLLDSLDGLINAYNIPILFSTHPRTQKRLDDLKGIKVNSKIHFSSPLGYFDYIHLQKNARCVLSDSGTLTEESSILNFPAVTIRNTHERPEGMDEGTLIMCGIKKSRVLAAVNMIIKQFEDYPNAIKIVPDYNIDKVSVKIPRIIFSYTEYINQTVWKKYT